MRISIEDEYKSGASFEYEQYGLLTLVMAYMGQIQKGGTQIVIDSHRGYKLYTKSGD
jgi:hypothetical protein